MFDFLFWNRDKEVQSLAEVIAVDLTKLNLSRLEIEKAVLMIAKAIAKSDILIQTESKEKSKQEYRLNIQPNSRMWNSVLDSSCEGTAHYDRSRNYPISWEILQGVIVADNR